MMFEHKTKVFLGGFPVHLTDADFYRYMRQYGSILGWRLIADNGKSRGYGFVTYKTYKSAQKATQANHFLEGKQMECNLVYETQYAKQHRDEIKLRKIFVNRLPYSLNEEGLKELFRPYGEIERATINREHYTNLSRGSGFVIFQDKEAAERLLSNHKTMLVGKQEINIFKCLLQEEIKRVRPIIIKPLDELNHQLLGGRPVHSWLNHQAVLRNGSTEVVQHAFSNSNLRLNFSPLPSAYGFKRWSAGQSTSQRSL